MTKPSLGDADYVLRTSLLPCGLRSVFFFVSKQVDPNSEVKLDLNRVFLRMQVIEHILQCIDIT